MAYNNGTAAMIAESHEERILRLEENVQDSSTKVGQLEVKVDHIVNQAEELNGKMDTMAQKLDRRIAHIDESVAKMVSGMVPVSARLAKLEESEAQRMARWENLKKGFFSLLIAGAGAVIAKVSNLITDSWWSR
jgi:peptidoglycan hydrolase CwlO-like protein